MEQLNNENYYSAEANQSYWSVSQYKDFCKCEAMAMAKIRGEFEQKQTKAMLIGTLCDRWFEGTLDKLKEEHPNIFFCRNGALKADFRKASQIVRRVEQDERFMQYMSGRKQEIFTFEMFGVPWKAKLDSLVAGICITDLKIVASIDGDSKVVKAFFRKMNYHAQGAVYQAGAEACGYGKLPFYLAIATKEAVTNFDIFRLGQPTLDMALQEIKEKMSGFIKVKAGLKEPRYCGVCDYCKSVKKARIRDYSELLEG